MQLSFSFSCRVDIDVFTALNHSSVQLPLRPPAPPLTSLCSLFSARFQVCAILPCAHSARANEQTKCREKSVIKLSPSFLQLTSFWRFHFQWGHGTSAHGYGQVLRRCAEEKRRRWVKPISGSFAWSDSDMRINSACCKCLKGTMSRLICEVSWGPIS